MAFKFRTSRRPVEINLPSQPRRSESTEEPLTGMVNGMEASAPEERLARALTKRKIPFLFRYVAGAPKGMPGWKELDFVVEHGGIIHLVEVDTAFTHRNKQNKDVLHDAILLNDSQIQQMGVVFPKVEHADGDNDLATDAGALSYVNRNWS